MMCQANWPSATFPEARHNWNTTGRLQWCLMGLLQSHLRRDSAHHINEGQKVAWVGRSYSMTACIFPCQNTSSLQTFETLFSCSESNESDRAINQRHSVSFGGVWTTWIFYILYLLHYCYRTQQHGFFTFFSYYTIVIELKLQKSSCV